MAYNFSVQIMAEVQGAGGDSWDHSILTQQVSKESPAPFVVQLCYTVWESIPENSQHLLHQVYQ